LRAKVYFQRICADLADKLPELFDLVAGSVIKSGDSVAIKLHFGEPGNKAYLKPHLVRPIVDAVQTLGGRPFLTDANTLYKGGRSDSKTHLESAKLHGYSKETMGVDIVIADGLDGHFVENAPVNLNHFKEVSLAKAAIDADCLIALSHFKGHDCTGFGGAIKNVGMGLGSRAGKQQMHADVVPRVDTAKCTGDGRCVKWCPTEAISIVNKKAQIDLSRCIGCAECVAACLPGAIGISWAGTPDSIQEKMAEYACGALQKKRGKAAFFNFLLDISPNCDCYPRNDAPIVPDIGVLASTDIVAIDRASVDLVNSSEGRVKGHDKFRTIYPDIDWSTQIKHAQKIGLGSQDHELIEV